MEPGMSGSGMRGRVSWLSIRLPAFLLREQFHANKAGNYAYNPTIFFKEISVCITLAAAHNGLVGGSSPSRPTNKDRKSVV